MGMLKPCPFCGSEANVFCLELAMLPYSVQCGNMSGNSCCVEPETCFYATEQEAINAWNIRTSAWVPVSERLPEVGGSYLCQIEAIKDLGTSRWIEVMSYNELSKKFEPYSGSTTTYDGEHVIAWQPLPEPYKE